jgi:hypothetical protein
MDVLEFNQAVGMAYTKAHAGDRHGAVALLRERFAQAPDTAKKHAEKIAEVVRARSQGGRCGCYITKFTHDLLTDALMGTAMDTRDV